MTFLAPHHAWRIGTGKVQWMCDMPCGHQIMVRSKHRPRRVECYLCPHPAPVQRDFAELWLKGRAEPSPDKE